jgi:hypothetical protein
MILVCARCQKPLTRAYIQDGPQSWGPKCAKAAGFTRPTGPRKPAEVTADPAQTALDLEPITARQSYAYTHNGAKVIALESGENPRVGVVAEPWFSEVRRVPASELVLIGQRYLQGGMP